MIKKHKIQNKFHSDSEFWNFRILGLFGSEFVSDFVLRISDFLRQESIDRLRRI